MHSLRPILVCALLCVALHALAVRLPSNTVYLAPGGRGPSHDTRVTAHRARIQPQMQRLERQHRLLAQQRAVRRAIAPKIDTFVVTGASSPALPMTRSRGEENVLSFAYEGWTLPYQQLAQQRLSQFLTQAYPSLVSVYGAPASSTTVTIELDTVAAISVEGGQVIIDQQTGAVRIKVGLPPDDLLTTDDLHYGFHFLHLILHAFHAPRLMGYDAWEEGLARAAALVVARAVNSNFDPTYEDIYLLMLYDYLNQPALASEQFFPPDGDWMMGAYRLGMAMSAWLKVFGEQPTAFADINALYYQELAANPGFDGSISALKTLLATAVPEIEYTPARTWYDRQYALSPTTVTGMRSYVYAFPAHEHVSLLLHYFYTSASGTDRPLSGNATLTYYSHDHIELAPEEGNEVAISSGGPTPGMGTIDPGFYNIGETAQQRIRIVVNVNGLRSTVYYPYFVEGAQVDDEFRVINANEFYGAVVGADSGAIAIASPFGARNPSLIQGAYGADLNTTEMGIPDFGPVYFTVNIDGRPPVTLQRNVGPGFNVALLRVGEDLNTSLTTSFLPRLQMISFPITPDNPDIASVLGVPAGAGARIAWWDPAKTETDKYRRHPDVEIPPVQPGRAYWYQPSTMTSVTVPGMLPHPSDPQPITLRPGWNMIGNAFTATLSPWTMLVNAGGIAFTFQEAVRQGLVGPLWRYLPDTGAYDVGTVLPVYEGAWICNLTNQPLTLVQSSPSRSARAPQVDPFRLLTDGGWGVRLHAAAGLAQDRMAVIGVSPTAKAHVDALDWQKPPAMGDGIRLALVNPGNRLAGAAYATDMRPAITARGEQWEFDVTCGRSENITLSWPDLRQVPRGYHLVLEDVAAGQRRYLRTVSAYSYRATGTPESPDVRRFRLTIAPASAVPLSFLNLMVVPTRSRGMNAVVTMSGTAELRLDVRSLSGKLIRRLEVPAAAANEAVTIPWDGRAAGDKMLPSGTYIMTLTATSPEGYVVRRNQVFSFGR